MTPKPAPIVERMRREEIQRSHYSLLAQFPQLIKNPPSPRNGEELFAEVCGREKANRQAHTFSFSRASLTGLLCRTTCVGVVSAMVFLFFKD